MKSPIVLLYSQCDSAEDWTAALQGHLPGIEVRVWPEVGDPADIDIALVWKPPPGLLGTLPNLRLIASLGMGVDHIFRDPELPAGVPVARLVDESIKTQMAEYVALDCLRMLRHADAYDAFMKEAHWEALPPVESRDLTVGILGLGEIGGRIAETLLGLGFTVLGWSRSRKSMEGVESFAGAEERNGFLSRSRVLVCVLPLTRETEDIVDAGLLHKLPRGAHLINIARGQHVVDEDLLAALNDGHLSGATLDVFRQEPLPVEHPFWTHPKVRVTPHIAGVTTAKSAAAQVAENIRRVMEGASVLHRVDRDKGY